MPLNIPAITEIVVSVRECLQLQVLPNCEDTALNLNLRICMSLLNTIERELELGNAFSDQEQTLLRELLTQLEPDRRGTIELMDNDELGSALEGYLTNRPEAPSDPRIIETLYQLALAKMAIDNPRYPAYRKLKNP